MIKNHLYIAFIWNQHQPYYRDIIKKQFIMPWVRLHATKDYYQMAAILKEHPQMRVTFNLTPCLIDQLEGYCNNGELDFYLQVMKPVQNLTQGDKIFLLQHYFDIQWDRVIEKHPRYQQLLEMQGRVKEPDSVKKTQANFHPQDYLDLQVWFNLAWIDPEYRQRDSFLRGLEEKGTGFTEEEKIQLMDYHRNLIKQVIPIHRELMKKGQIEIITSPYYHPIIPLLIDSYSALRASPGMHMPSQFHHIDDAREQIKMGVRQYQRLFDRPPRGFWPPEQAVSPELIPLLCDQGFSWTVADEQVLVKSIDEEIIRDGYGHVLNPQVLYQPYRVIRAGCEVAVVFRDHHLSDRIGFEYQHMTYEAAAADMLHRLHKIRESLKQEEGNFLVTIALDGENAWEWYPNDKGGFIHSLYNRISKDPYLHPVTVEDYIAQNPPRRKIGRIFTGSWVDHSLSRWIGTDSKNQMWDYLVKVRSDLEEYMEFEEEEEKKLACALENMYIAEGSDYMWWVDSRPYYLAAPFEALFRKHLINVYRALEKKPPEFLYEPILKPGLGDAQWKGISPIEGPISMA